ncbi:thiamine pyrophosphate-dependent enzyme [Trinickia symbiotica]|uniref:thiamine pyrophosphate-dependent enzyme n=1 Tax=Trinickia symbiotica TaxID=863227 RepID=UPI0015E6DEF3|nr:thiamine pyrophosphate-dependent enzyme [Trinickia symbiotica]
MTDTVSDHVVAILKQWGVDTVFGLPGDGINGLVESFRKASDSIRYVHLRHEESAALAACAYAKFSGRLGVCFSTAAPGAVHLLNGLYDAKVDGAPVLAITGMTYHDLIGTHYLQDINQDYLYQDVAYYNQRVMGPEHLENVMNYACRTALSRSGVAHVAIPIDIQAMPASKEQRFKRNIKGHTSSAYQPPTRTPQAELIAEAADLLGGCEKIAILAGAGARGCRAELEQLAERLGAPIVKAQLGKECVPDTSPYTTGGIGVVGTLPSVQALKGCNGLLIVGSSFPYIEFLPKPGQAACVQIDHNPEHIGLRYPADIGLVGDARATLHELLGKLRRNESREFLTLAQSRMREWRALMEERGTSTALPMCPQVVAHHLPELLDDNAIICGDSGTVTVWQARMELRENQRFSFSGTMCSMMAALPYSIGASVAYPGRQVVAFTGDGSFTMMMGEFASLVQHRLPVKVVVMKNNTLGLIKWEQMLYLGNPEYGVDLSPVDFVKVAEACGARGVRIEDPTRCRDQLKDALAMPGPVLIECIVDPLEPPWPPMVKKDDVRLLYDALARGEVNRKQIGLTIGRHAAQEFRFSASPFGIAGRVIDKLTGHHESEPKHESDERKKKE